MNPGKVVNAPAMTDNLRYGAGYRAAELPVVYPYQRHGGFAGAVELCNGSGVCRKELVGTMCPSFMATKEEEHSTRGRANLLRALLDGRLPPERESEDRVLQALDLCLACKACKAECPSGVDMARLKSDFLHRYYRDRRRPLADRLFGAPDVLARWGSRLGPLARWADRRGWAASLLARTIGFDRRRSLPKLARQSFASWFRRMEAASQPQSPRGEVALFPDTFTNYFEPRIGIAACRVLWALGYRVVLAPVVCCGRPAISRDRAGSRGRAFRSAASPARAPPSSASSPRVSSARRDPRSARGGPSRRPGDRACGSLRRVPGRSPFAPHRGRGEGSRATATRRRFAGRRWRVSFRPPAPRARWPIRVAAEWPAAGYTSDHFELSLAIGERRLFPAVGPWRRRTRWWRPARRHQVLDDEALRIHPAEYIAQYLADGGGPDPGT